MIGVVAATADREIVGEFFELFKTPWEYYRADGRYDVVLLAGNDFEVAGIAADLIVAFGGRAIPGDRQVAIECGETLHEPVLSFGGISFPIYGNCVSLDGEGTAVICADAAGRAVGLAREHQGRLVARLGYDLFEEVRTVLTDGQPTDRAHFRTLDRHVDMMRNLMLMTGIEVIEVPPVPAGYEFIACLTHDVDHPRVRLHRFDHTMMGFLYRALVGSAARLLSGRLSVRQLARNWAAAVRLPLVYLGLAKDFWYGFDRYTEIEQDADSTFFVLPFKGDPGRRPPGMAPKKRASSYGASDIAERLRALVGAGCEIGLHGLDAWLDAQSAERERHAVSTAAGAQGRGVRMHWLYFGDDSPRALEAAGFSYDSTIGYNETIGFRAGTAQVYKLLGTRNLLELPLHVMDTALFRRNYLDLSFPEAAERLASMIEEMRASGGVLTVNWHDRSIAPERLWNDFYAELLSDLRANAAWCTGAARAVGWFEKRRSVQFAREAECLRVIVPQACEHTDDGLPALRLRVHRPADRGSASTDSILASTTTHRFSRPMTAGQR